MSLAGCADSNSGMLADLAGITKAMLSAYETGRQCPSLLTLVKLLAALGFSWQEFGEIG